MKVYIDSSWLLRVLLKQSSVKPLPVNAEVYSSALLIVECRRALDRHLKRKLISDEVYSDTVGQLQEYLQSINLLQLDPEILQRAAGSFFLPIGSLDALHLATALKISEIEKKIVHMATFDEELALAAKAHELKTIPG